MEVSFSSVHVDLEIGVRVNFRREVSASGRLELKLINGRGRSLVSVCERCPLAEVRLYQVGNQSA